MYSVEKLSKIMMTKLYPFRGPSVPFLPGFSVAFSSESVSHFWSGRATASLVLKSKNGVLRTPFPASAWYKVKASPGSKGLSLKEFRMKRTEMPAQKTMANKDAYHFKVTFGSWVENDFQSGKSRKRERMVYGQKLKRSCGAWVLMSDDRFTKTSKEVRLVLKAKYGMSAMLIARKNQLPAMKNHFIKLK